MIASAQPAMDARRSRRADMTRREMLAFMAALFFLAILPSSLALTCKCNSEFVLSDCRFNGWTCTVPDNIGACSTRIRLYNGTIRTYYDCVRTNLNPVLCSGAYNSNTTVYECCTDGDFCNENLSPTFPPSPTLPPSSDSTNSSISPSQTTSANSYTYSGDPSQTTLPPSSDSTNSSISPSQATSANSYTYSGDPSQTTLPPSSDSTNSSISPSQTTSANSYTYSGDPSQTTLPPSSDSTNSSISPSQTTSANSYTSSGDSFQTTSASSSPSSVMVSTSSAIRPTPDPGKLRCDCSGYLCHGKSSCETNYKCYREVRYNKDADYVETRLGCMDSSPPVNLDGLDMCEGKLDTETTKMKCCDDGDFCNRNLSVVLTLSPSKTIGAPSDDSSKTIGAPSDDSSDDGDIYIILSIIIIVVTMLTVVIIVLVLLSVFFFMCYQRDKVKVVDRFQNKKRPLSAGSPYTEKGGLHLPPDYVENVHV